MFFGAHRSFDDDRSVVFSLLLLLPTQKGDTRETQYLFSVRFCTLAWAPCLRRCFQPLYSPHFSPPPPTNSIIQTPSPFPRSMFVRGHGTAGVTAASISGAACMTPWHQKMITSGQEKTTRARPQQQPPPPRSLSQKSPGTPRPHGKSRIPWVPSSVPVPVPVPPLFTRRPRTDESGERRVSAACHPWRGRGCDMGTGGRS